MSQQNQLDEERIFHVARGVDDASLRDEYLTQVCAGDQALRERVEELLDVHEKEQSFLKSQDAHQPTALYSEISETVGQQIGRFKLLQKIGEGGFGVVYLAEQSRPVRRKVALKVIKPGMDTSAVVARFEAERQALALMDHPNIAKVLDGGATESGRPYFVMELVKGVPITQFCDENKCSLRERLELFTTVCRAIQHAHQKGIIHRDIKPSNVLLTLHDGKPVPKVIDFGVSKAISQQLTEKTLFTAHGQMIGTPQYMSPEQAEMSGLDIDTRSDIYSLGILMYELLTGVTPLDPEKLRSSGFLEMQRLIREDEPVQPSKRYSTLGEQSATIATKRQTDPNKLGNLLRGELDWIVMKTLEKDRNRRYETPDALAKDVENYLNDETVDACPPSMAYRFQKFARRNKPLLITASTFVVLLMVWAFHSRSLRIETEHHLNEIYLLHRQQTLGTALSLAAAKQDDRALKVIEKAEIREEDKRILEEILSAEQQIGEGHPQAAIDILEGLDTNEEDLIVNCMLANAYFVNGNYWKYSVFPEAQGEADPQTPYEHLFAGMVEFWLNFPQSITHLDEAVTLTPSPLSFTYRARSSALLACSTRNFDRERSQALIDQAVEDIEIASKLYVLKSPDEMTSQIRSNVLGTHLLVLIHAYNINRHHAAVMENAGFQQEAEERRHKADLVMKNATKVVEELSSRKNLDNLEYVRAWIGFYHHYHANDLTRQGLLDQAEIAEKDARETLKDTMFGPWHVIAEYFRLDPQDTNFEDQKRDLLIELNSISESGDLVRDLAFRKDLILAFQMLMSHEREDGRNEVNELIKKLKMHSALDFPKVLEICQIYRLLGDISGCQKFAKPFANDETLTENLPEAKKGLKYNAGHYDDDLNNYLGDSTSTGSTTYRLFIVGLSELTQGHPAEAQKWFQRVEDEGIFHSAEYAVSLAFLERLQKDPNWVPHWVHKDNVGSED